MKRREFFRKATISAIGAGVIGQQAIAQSNSQTCVRKTYTGTRIINEKQKLEFSMTFCPRGFLSSKATMEEKIVILKILYKQTSSGSVGTSNHESLHTVKSTIEHPNAASAQSIELSLSKLEKNEFDLSNIFDINNLKLVYSSFANEKLVRVLNRDGWSYVELKDNIQEDIEEDCFLTTACVKYLNKEDNCKELTILRKFRDEELSLSENGKRLILEYYEIAPQIVRNINASNVKNQIYSEIYSEMILPTIENIENKKYDQAINIYRNYTYMLKSRFYKDA